MVTKKKLTTLRRAVEEERYEEDQPLPDPSSRPRWRKQGKLMEESLKGIDPDRFEALADGRLP